MKYRPQQYNVFTANGVEIVPKNKQKKTKTKKHKHIGLEKCRPNSPILKVRICHFISFKITTFATKEDTISV